VLPFGVDKLLFRPEAADEKFRQDALSRAGMRTSVPVIAAMGRFAVEKQWQVLLRAFLTFRERNDGVLVAFGDGPERARLAKLVEHRRDVQFMGFERDKKRLASALAAADLFVHACPFETFGLSVAQATACGLPLVVPDEGGAAEQADDTHAERFRTGDPLACAAAIERVLARDAHSRRAHARRAGSALPDVRDQIQKTVDIYRELLQPQRDEARKNAGPHLFA
jgi:alpha-1,6-mannosyltransferase